MLFTSFGLVSLSLLVARDSCAASNKERIFVFVFTWTITKESDGSWSVVYNLRHFTKAPSHSMVCHFVCIDSCNMDCSLCMLCVYINASNDPNDKWVNITKITLSLPELFPGCQFMWQAHRARKKIHLPISLCHDTEPNLLTNTTTFRSTLTTHTHKKKQQAEKSQCG